MLIAAFLDTAGRHADKLAAKDPQTEVTYGQLAALSAGMARLIDAETQRPNVGVMLPSSVGFAVSLYGGLWAGKVVVPLNPVLQTDELRAIVADAGLDVVLTCEPLEGVVRPLPVRPVFLEKAGLGQALRAGAASFPGVPPAGPDDVAVILYTSGTTGVPRGVCLTQNNLHANAFGCASHVGMRTDDRFLGILPMFHSFGLTTALLVPTLLGATVFYQPRFQPGDVLRAIVEQDISVLLAIASMFGTLARTKSATADAFRRVRIAVSGGEPLPQAVFEECRQRLRLTILEGYGLTETSPVVAVNIPGAHRPGTVGRPIAGVEVVAMDDLGRAVPAGTQGEICVRGHCVMKAYYNKPEDTAAALSPDGWLRTGDLGMVDADGYIRITGRKKEMIIVGGENVFPREIETVLDQHPVVAESAVIGIPDASRGEVVVGFVVPREDQGVTPLELREHCRRHLAGYKVPRHIFIDKDLPRGPTGKIAKRLLHTRLPAVAADP